MLVSCELFSNVMLVRMLQDQNALSPMLVTLLGISMLVKLLHIENAEEPMLITPLDISMLVKLLHIENALEPMLVTLYLFPLYVTSVGITIAPDVDCLTTVATPSFIP